jgi:hypothetical protein
VGWIQLRGNGQVLNRFFETAAFLDEFVSEPIAAKKALWVFSDHLSERIEIHAGSFVSAGRMIPLRGRREPVAESQYPAEEC